MHTFFNTLLFTIVLSLTSQAYSQQIQVVNFNEFESRLHHSSDSVYFVNFWATWCVPCVKEMPAINKVIAENSNKPLKVLLVSLDLPSNITSRLAPFIEKHNITAEVIVLDDPDFNSWIDKVDKNWGGGIPASLIYTKDSRNFYEQSFEYEELNNLIKKELSLLNK